VRSALVQMPQIADSKRFPDIFFRYTAEHNEKKIMACGEQSHLKCSLQEYNGTIAVQSFAFAIANRTRAEVRTGLGVSKIAFSESIVHPIALC
jgi:hypothetical protein